MTPASGKRHETHFMRNFLRLRAHSRKYRLIRFLYGIPVSADKPLASARDKVERPLDRERLDTRQQQ